MTAETFGAAVRRHRLACNTTSQRAKGRTQGMNQTRLADLMEMDISLISRIESGERNPSYATCVLICDALDVKGDERAYMFALTQLWPDHWPLPTCDGERE